MDSTIIAALITAGTGLVGIYIAHKLKSHTKDSRVEQEETREFIKVRCLGCGKRVTAPSRHSGRRVKCPSCYTVLQVPSDHISPVSSEQQARREVPKAMLADAKEPGRSPNRNRIILLVVGLVV